MQMTSTQRNVGVAKPLAQDRGGQSWPPRTQNELEEGRHVVVRDGSYFRFFLFQFEFFGARIVVPSWCRCRLLSPTGQENLCLAYSEKPCVGRSSFQLGCLGDVVSKKLPMETPGWDCSQGFSGEVASERAYCTGFLLAAGLKH